MYGRGAGSRMVTSMLPANALDAGKSRHIVNAANQLDLAFMDAPPRAIQLNPEGPLRSIQELVGDVCHAQGSRYYLSGRAACQEKFGAKIARQAGVRLT